MIYIFSGLESCEMDEVPGCEDHCAVQFCNMTNGYIFTHTICGICGHVMFEDIFEDYCNMKLCLEHIKIFYLSFFLI